LEEKKMRIILALALLGSLAAAGSADARQNPPYDLWCRDQAVGFGGTVPICMAYTLQQCLASRAAQGESCYLNPRYATQYRR
jgi:hypothetical protein